MSTKSKTLIAVLFIIFIGTMSYSIWEMSRPLQDAENRLSELQLLRKDNKDSIAVLKQDQYPVLTAANSTIDSFFSAVHDYKSQTEFDNRYQVAKKYATDDAIKQSDSIHSDEYHFVKNSKIVANLKNSWFVPVKADQNSMTGQVLVDYEVSNDDNNPGIVEELYSVSYDATQKKLTSIKFLGLFNKNTDSAALSD